MLTTLRRAPHPEAFECTDMVPVDFGAAVRRRADAGSQRTGSQRTGSQRTGRPRADLQAAVAFIALIPAMCSNGGRQYAL